MATCVTALRQRYLYQGVFHTAIYVQGTFSAGESMLVWTAAACGAHRTEAMREGSMSKRRRGPLRKAGPITCFWCLTDA